MVRERSPEQGRWLARATLTVGLLGLTFVVLVIVTSFIPTTRPIFGMSAAVLVPLYLGMFIVHIHTVFWITARRGASQDMNRQSKSRPILTGLVLVIAALAAIWLSAFFNATVHKLGLPNNVGHQYALRLHSHVTRVSYSTYRNAQSLALRLFFAIPGIFYAGAAAVALIRLES